MSKLLDVLLVITCIVLLFLVTFIRKHYVLKSRINELTSILKTQNSLEKDSLKYQIAELQFQKESYTDMLGRQSDWFIAYVSILFFIFGFFGYTMFIKRVDEGIKTVKKELKSNYRNQIKDYELHKKDYLDLKIEVYSGLADFNFLVANENSDAPAQLIKHALISAQYNKLCYDLSNKKEFMSLCISHISMASFNLQEIQQNPERFSDDIDFIKDQKGIIIEAIDVISNITEPIIKDMISDIRSLVLRL